MSKFLDGLYKRSSWIVIILSLVAYFFYRTLSLNGSIEQTIQDISTWIHLTFVVLLQVTMVSVGYDSGTDSGINTDEYSLADKLNNQIVSSSNNEIEDFRNFISKLNDEERKNLQDDYLFSVGKKELDQLSDKELKEYKKLKPIQHNIYGFNLPLYYEITKNGKVNYSSSIKKNEGKNMQKLLRAFTGLIFGAMTINITFNWENIGDALVSLLVIGSGLVITFIMSFMPQVFKLKYELPRKVILKKTLWDTYVDYKNGNHKLVKYELESKNESKIKGE